MDFPPEVPADAAANTWFAYGYREGIPRMLDLWDPVRDAPRRRETIPDRGARHGRSGHRPTSGRLQPQLAAARPEYEHIDDVSRDEPFIEQVNGKDFVVVPYTLRNNDILLIEGRNYSPFKFLDQIKLDFDQLYEEAGRRRRTRSPRRRRSSVRPFTDEDWRRFFEVNEKEFFKTVRPASLLKRFAMTEEVANAALRVDGGVVQACF